MEKEFVPYEQALALKELGFDEPCFATYDNIDKQFELQDFFQTYETFPSHIISAPTFSQTFRWFRENYDLVHRIDRDGGWRDGGWWICTILNLYDNIEIHIEHCYPDSYEEAELECLKKLIELVKQK